MSGARLMAQQLAGGRRQLGAWLLAPRPVWQPELPSAFADGQSLHLHFGDCLDQPQGGLSSVSLLRLPERAAPP